MVEGSYSVIYQKVHVGLELENYQKEILMQTQMLGFNQDSCPQVFLGMFIY